MVKEYYKLATVNSEYCDYLREFDYRVSYNANKKKLRPFVGVLFEIDKIKYFAPLSSPKPKHLRMKNKIDFYKLDNGKLGAINFNNMIPVIEGEYYIIDMNVKGLKRGEKQYKILLSNQLRWLNRYGKSLRENALNLYNKKVENRLPKKINERCCDFKLLEEKCREYKK